MMMIMIVYYYYVLNYDHQLEHIDHRRIKINKRTTIDILLIIKFLIYFFFIFFYFLIEEVCLDSIETWSAVRSL